MKAKLKDDFYDYINHDWEKKTKIPSYLASISSYGQLHLDIEKKLRKLVKNWAENKEPMPENNGIHEMVKFYKMLKNTKMQTKLGWKPAKKIIEKIEKINSYEEFNNHYAELEKVAAWLPYDFAVAEDFIDNTIYTLWFSIGNMLLPSKEYYSRKEGSKIIKVMKKVLNSLLVSYGKTKTEASEIIDSAFALDAKLVEYQLSSEEQNQIEKLYNPVKYEEFVQKSKIFNLSEHAILGIKNKPKQVVNLTIKFLNNLDNIYTKVHFKDVKNLILVHTFLSLSKILNPETRKAYFEISKVIRGVEKMPANSKWAYDMATGYFDEIFSLYYGKENFSEESRKDVIKMINNIIKIYQNRLSKLDWMSEETKQKAIFKLSKIIPMVGYPDYIYPYYHDFKTKTFKEGGDLISNVYQFRKIATDYKNQQYGKKVDQNIWEMPSFVVNAYFNPFSNRIVFPAGYLQKPFYDYHQSSSKNYAGLGMTIGHEISHAFDNNGAQFDENGSFVNWWTEKDYAEFKKKTDLMIKLFDGYQTKYGKVNGKLTVSENIADQGGILTSYIAAQKEKDFNPDEFFANLAWCERGKSTKQLSLQRLLTDPHSPAKERINLQLQIFKPFKNHYQLTKTDKMFRDDEEFFDIW